MESSDASRRDLARHAVLCTVVVYALYGVTRAMGASQLAPLVLLAGFLFAPLWMLRRSPALARDFEVGPDTPLPPWRWRGAVYGGALSLTLLPLFAVVFWVFYDGVCGLTGGTEGGRGLDLSLLYQLEESSLGSHRVERFVRGLCARHNGAVFPDAVRWPASWSDWSSGGAALVIASEVLLVAVPEEVF
ncbi:MAG: hypothetical protein ACPHRO_09745, partial [Nannocystaceae bacterium]